MRTLIFKRVLTFGAMAALASMPCLTSASDRSAPALVSAPRDKLVLAYGHEQYDDARRR